MTFEQPRSTFASFKACWIRTSPSLHLATFDSSIYLGAILDNATLTFTTEVTAQQSEIQCTHFRASTLF